MTSLARWIVAGIGLLIVIAPPCVAQSRATTEAEREWWKQISTQLINEKRFPPAAKGQTGDARVRFTVDRKGRLLSYELVQSTGSPMLDAEAIAMVRRAAPFPPPPQQQGHERLTFILPIAFRQTPERAARENLLRNQRNPAR
jgi:periplasmic protein TonB